MQIEGKALESNSPLVSVCCITFNHELDIAQAIESFLMQRTSFPIEIIIHDDASSDDTAQIVTEYAMRYPNKRFFRRYKKGNQHSQGIKISQKLVWPEGSWQVYRNLRRRRLLD